jgi:acetyl esterase
MQLSLPTSTSVSMEYEVSRDEAEAHGKQLADAGVPTEVIRFAGLVHGVYWISGAVPRATEIRCAATEFLKAQFSNPQILIPNIAR